MKVIAEAMGVSRTHQYEKTTTNPKGGKCFYHKADDARYLPLIRAIIDARATYGYRRVTAVMNRMLKTENKEGINHKRVYRIMKKNNLLLQRHTGRPVRVHDGTVRMIRSNMRWCSDAFEIACWNGERVRVAFSMDCCDCEVMSYVATTGGICGDMIRDLMAESIEARFGLVDKVPDPIQWLSDNGLAILPSDTTLCPDVGGWLCTTPITHSQSRMRNSFCQDLKRDYVHMNHLHDARDSVEIIPSGSGIT